MIYLARWAKHHRQGLVMWSPSSANALAGGTAPGVLPGTLPPEEHSHGKPSGPGSESVIQTGPAVVIGISPELRAQLDRWFGPEPEEGDGILPEEVREAAKNPFKEPSPEQESAIELSPEEQQRVQELAARDAEVRAHENAHVAAAGGLAGAPSYSYTVGPDGKRYAVGGSVKIDMSKERTPEETLAKAERIRAAAMAPAEPSAKDTSVASKASQMAADARSEIAREKRMEAQESTEDPNTQEKGPWTEVAEQTDGTPEPGSTLSHLA